MIFWLMILHFTVITTFLISFIGMLRRESDFFVILLTITTFIVFPIVGTIMIVSGDMIYIVSGLMYIILCLTIVIRMILYHKKVKKANNKWNLQE